MFNEIQEYNVLVRDNFTCYHPGCKKSGTEKVSVVHMIKPGFESENFIIDFIIEYYEKIINCEIAGEIIDHPLNLTTVCKKHVQASQAMSVKKAQMITIAIIKEKFPEWWEKVV